MISTSPPRENVLSVIFRRRPNLTVFATNFCIMTLELVAGRLIAPFVGVSLDTWTAVIGIVLAGITLGNWVGGIAADRWPSWRLVGFALTGAGLGALFSLTITSFGAVALVSIPLPYVVGVLGITTIFLFPSIFLGMVSPIVAKMTVRDLATTGNVVGRIYASAALGSIVGTYATGFWLISQLGTRAIIITISVILLIMALAFLDLEDWRGLPRRHKYVAAALLVVLLGGAMVAVANDLCFAESRYYCIRVEMSDDGTTKIMYLNRLLHSYTDLAHPEVLAYDYEKVFATLYEYARQSEPRVLFVGGGAYTLPRYLVYRYGTPAGTVVEIDPVVSEIAFSEFDMPRVSSIATANVDARIYMQNLAPDEKFDLIVGDAFSDYSIPYHLTTREFSQMMANHLTAEGIYAANVIDSLEPGLFVASYLRTLQDVFAHTYVFQPTRHFAATDRTTFVIVGSQQALDQERLREAASRLGYSSHVRPLADKLTDDLLTQGRRNMILTDDFVPVDNLIAPVFRRR
jgi:spermidine synthase